MSLQKCLLFLFLANTSLELLMPCTVAGSATQAHDTLADHPFLISLQGYDVILGADVCYSLNALPALFAVAARLLSCRPASRFLLGYVSR